MYRALAFVVVVTLVAADDRDGKTPKLPKTTVGADVIGERIPLAKLQWLTTPENKPLPVLGKVTLVRWWTDTCPFCERSLPAIQGLAEEFAKRGLQTIAVYHPKPPRAVDGRRIIDDAREREYQGTVAVDMDWGVLREFYLRKKSRPATSVTFILDHEGRVRFVQKGPEFRPSKKPGDDQVNREYGKVRAAIASLLARIPKKTDTKKR